MPVVKLAERAVDAVAALVVASFSTELTAIDTDRADFTLPKPATADVFAYELREMGADPTVEVFEDDDFELANPYTDAASQRAVYDIGITIRATVKNNANWTELQMHQIRRRYAAGLAILLLKNYDLADSDDDTQIATVGSITTSTDTGDQGIEAVQCAVQIVVKCTECVS